MRQSSKIRDCFTAMRSAMTGKEKFASPSMMDIYFELVPTILITSQILYQNYKTSSCL